jgi:hypothetical protein
MTDPLVVPAPQIVTLPDTTLQVVLVLLQCQVDGTQPSVNGTLIDPESLTARTADAVRLGCPR